MKTLKPLHLLATLLMMFILSSTAFSEPGYIKASGASSLGAVLMPVAKNFDQESGIKVQVSDTGSGGGLKCLPKSECDVGLVTGKIKPEDATKIKVNEVGWDGIGILVNHEVKITNLSTAQIAGIFSGKIKNWKEVGGKDAAIKVFSRDPSRSTTKQMEDHFKIKLTGDEIKGPHSAVINHLKHHANSIGFTTLGGERSGADAPILLSIDGIAGSLEMVRAGKYPLIRSMYINTQKNPSPEVEKFMAYLQKHLPAALEKDGYISAAPK